jgi:Cu(I)/Ag(I) efflux system membrane protein CusA/SilA
MTAAVIVGGLAPILWSHGAGADAMKRIATPMIGGIVTSTIMELVVFPAIFFLWRSRTLKGSQVPQVPPPELVPGSAVAPAT